MQNNRLNLYERVPNKNLLVKEGSDDFVLE